MIAGRSTIRRTVAVVLAAALLSIPVLPAFAADGDVPPAPQTIVSGVVVGGIDLSGLTAAEAEATLTANVATPTLAPLAVNAVGVVYTLSAVRAVDLDVAGLVADAVAATTPVEIAARYSVDAPYVTSFVAGIATHTNRTSINAARKIVKRRLKLTASRVGYKVDQASTVATITAALTTELATAGSAQPTVTAYVASIQPKVTAKNIGKAIIVVLSERRVYLWSGARLEIKYRCAVGMARYPTPKGTWKIVRKVKNPSWYNNGAGWARNMPSYIGPGPRNPLGTRALYLNASGIRIHGIPASENSSIGHAASHGCIRLKNSDAINLFPRVNVGIPVYIIK